MTCHAAIVSRELGIPCVVGTGDATTQAARRRGRDRRRRPRRRARGRGARPSARRRHRRRSPPHRSAAGHRHAAAGQPLRALAGRARRRARRRRRRPAARRADDHRGARGRAPAAACWRRAAREEFVERMAKALERVRRRASPRGRSPTGRSTSARTSSAACEGGDRFEPEEANPMIGYRGALRYIARAGRPAAWSSTRSRRVWDEGHTNLHVMLPFVRTARELAACRGLIVARVRPAATAPASSCGSWPRCPSVLFNLERYAELGDRRASRSAPTT